MCQTCQPIRSYQTVSDAHALSSIKEQAYHLVDQGLFTMGYEFNDPTTDFQEVQFHCEDCGKTHILWLHTYYCRVGGEWRCL